MKTENNLALVQRSDVPWEVMKERAQMLVKTGFMPAAVKTAEQAIAIILTGQELGIPMMESLRGINVVQGKPTVSPQTMLALARKTGELEKLNIQDNPDGCVVTIKRRGYDPVVIHFGDKEARDLGLFEKENYKKQRATMYRWRALAGALRLAFSDAISGLYTPEEMGATVIANDTGEMEIINAPCCNNEFPAEQEISIPFVKVPKIVEIRNTDKKYGNQINPESVKPKKRTIAEYTKQEPEILKGARIIEEETQEELILPEEEDEELKELNKEHIESLRKKMWAKTRAAGFTEQQFRLIVEKLFKIKSLKEMTEKQVNDWMRILEEMTESVSEYMALFE